MRRFLAVLSSVAVALGMLVGVTTPASAADLGTVTFIASPPGVAPSTVTGEVGDRFTVSYSGINSLDVTGPVSLGGTDCSSPSQCFVSSGGPDEFTIDAAGSVVLEESGGSGPTTLTIEIISPISVPLELDRVYSTMYLNADGGTCSGIPMQYTKFRNQNGTVVLPGEPECQRAGYSLKGWVLPSGSLLSPLFDPGSVVPIGNESFTLYAVWVPTGVLITYDANIGADSACIDAAGNDVPAGEGRTVTELNPETLASSAPCEPDNDQLELIGWATSGDGPVAYALGGPEAFDEGSRQTLYAVWQPNFISACGQVEALRTENLAFSCMDFGDVPVGWRSNLEVRITNIGGRSLGKTVFPFRDVTRTSNGLLERVRLRDPSECNPGTGPLRPGQSCIVRYAWTPRESGPVGPIRLRLCSSFVERCFSTPDGEGLRGNAYVPEPADNPAT